MAVVCPCRPVCPARPVCVIAGACVPAPAPVHVHVHVCRQRVVSRRTGRLWMCMLPSVAVLADAAALCAGAVLLPQVWNCTQQVFAIGSLNGGSFKPVATYNRSTSFAPNHPVALRLLLRECGTPVCARACLHRAVLSVLFRSPAPNWHLAPPRGPRAHAGRRHTSRCHVHTRHHHTDACGVPCASYPWSPVPLRVVAGWHRRPQARCPVQLEWPSSTSTTSCRILSRSRSPARRSASWTWPAKARWRSPRPTRGG